MVLLDPREKTLREVIAKVEAAMEDTREARTREIADRGEQVRQSAFEQSGERSAESGETRSSYKSVRGATTEELLRLDDARQMTENGEDPEIVRRHTGWFQGLDGKWRIEIDDSTAKLIDTPAFEVHETADGDIYRTALLKDILENSELLESYPELGDYTVIMQETEPGVQGTPI